MKTAEEIITKIEGLIKEELAGYVELDKKFPTLQEETIIDCHKHGESLLEDLLDWIKNDTQKEG